MHHLRCPISYDQITSSDQYSKKGLAKLSKNIRELKPLPFTAQELLIESAKHASKMSIQGVQPKLSAKLNSKLGQFDIVDSHGRYILKPPLMQYIQVPENEDVTMRMANVIGIETPLHGLVYNKDGSFTYFIKRFDRISHASKRLVEDFAQLTNHNREIKYKSSMEEVVKTIDKHCTFPQIEKKKLLILTLFNFLVGNEDMHLKNFSLITIDQIIQLSPAYDLLNTTLIMGSAKEEIALPLNGKKANLTRRDFLDYFAIERMGLNRNIVNEILTSITTSIPKWFELIEQCFLAESQKAQYLKHLETRLNKLALNERFGS